MLLTQRRGLEMEVVHSWSAFARLRGTKPTGKAKLQKEATAPMELEFILSDELMTLFLVPRHFFRAMPWRQERPAAPVEAAFQPDLKTLGCGLRSSLLLRQVALV